MNNAKSQNPFFNVLAIIGAFTAMPLIEAGKWLSKRAYKGLGRAICYGIPGVGIACFASILTATYFGWDLEWNFFIWLAMTLAVWPFTFFIAWPAVALVFDNTIVKLYDKIFDWVGKLAKKELKEAVTGFVNCLKVLPGSGKLWGYVEDEEKGYKWVTAVVTFLSGAGFVGIAAYVAYTTYTCVLPYVTFTNPYFLSELTAGLIAALPTVLVAGIPLQILEKNSLHVSGLTISGATTYFLHPVTALGVSAFGLPATLFGGAVPTACVVSPVVFLLLAAYAYPAVHGILKSGLFAKLLKGVKYLIEQTYDEKDKEYQPFFTHVVNIAASLALGVLIVMFGSAVYDFIPGYAFLAVAAIATVVAYIGLGEWLEDGPGNVSVGLVTAALSGWCFHANFAESFGTVGLWTSIGGVAIVTFFFAVPFVYIALRFVTNGIGLAKPVGKVLDDAHEEVTKLGEKVVRWWEKNVYKHTYNDDSRYQTLFAHVSNLALLGLGAWQAVGLVTGWAFPIWLTVIIGLGFAFLAYLTYLILGKILNDFSSQVIGWGLSAIAGLWVGYGLFEANGDYWWLAVVLGLTVFSIASAIVFPLVYLVVKAIANPLFTGWLTTPIENTYNFFWKRFEGHWDRFVKIYKIVHENVFKPAFMWFAGILAAAKQAWDNFRGRRNA